VVHWDRMDNWDLSYISVMGSVGIVLPILSGTLGWDGQLEFEQSAMGPVGIVST